MKPYHYNGAGLYYTFSRLMLWLVHSLICICRIATFGHSPAFFTEDVNNLPSCGVSRHKLLLYLGMVVRASSD